MAAANATILVRLDSTYSSVQEAIIVAVVGVVILSVVALATTRGCFAYVLKRRHVCHDTNFEPFI